MSFPSERRGALTGTLLTLLSILALLVTGAFVGNATAEPPFGQSQFGFSHLAADTTSHRSLPIQYASHHEHDNDSEGHHHDDEGDDDDEELERELRHVEMERASLESFYGALELIEKMTQIASDDDSSAVLAVAAIKDAFETDEAIELLEEVVAKAPSQAARRLARIELAELYGEKEDLHAVRKQLKALIYTSAE